MKDEAAANAAADAKEKERIDKLNEADALIFQTEKTMKEAGDKLPADLKSQIETALGKLKDAHKAQDLAAIDVAKKELEDLFQKMYQAAGAAGAQGQPGGPQGPFGGAQGPFGGQQGPQQGGNQGGAEDVPFEEVK